jgi:hypothetical protein
MLFDLRGAGRRTTVKIVYLTLAVLMGGGLVLFGIGGDVSGGLVDAITSQSSSGGSDADTFRKRADETQRAAEANPKDPAAWAEATRARYQLARAGDNINPQTGEFTAAGVAQLRIASQDWQRHLALNPNPPDDSVASIMVKAYTVGLNDPAKAVAAQEIITEARPKTRTFQVLAELAYAAGQTRKGDLAAKKALELVDAADRETLKSELDSAKQQALASQLQQGTPTATPTPKAGGKKEKNSSGKG